MRNKTNVVRIAVVSAILLLGMTVPVFAQEILATFGLGARVWGYNSGAEAGMTIGATALFVGKTGLTISGGTEVAIWEVKEYWGYDGYSYYYPGYTEIFVSPMLGLGYVYYRRFYVGGILNLIYNNIAPTFVAGFDFGHFLLGGQLSYMRQMYNGTNGFRFSLGVGVNLGTGGS